MPIDTTDYEVARQRVNERLRRTFTEFFVRWGLPVIAVLAAVFWFLVMPHPMPPTGEWGIYLIDGRTYFGLLPRILPLVVLASIVVFWLLRWRERAIQREVARIQHERGAEFDDLLAADEKPKRDRRARLVVDDDGELLAFTGGGEWLADKEGGASLNS